MKEIFFGWITKGQYQLSFLDSIIGLIEIFGLMYLIIYVIYIIYKFKEKINNRKNKGE